MIYEINSGRLLSPEEVAQRQAEAAARGPLPGDDLAHPFPIGKFGELRSVPEDLQPQDPGLDHEAQFERWVSKTPDEVAASNQERIAQNRAIVPELAHFFGIKSEVAPVVDHGPLNKREKHFVDDTAQTVGYGLVMHKPGYRGHFDIFDSTKTDTPVRGSLIIACLRELGFRTQDFWVAPRKGPEGEIRKVATIVPNEQLICLYAQRGSSYHHNGEHSLTVEYIQNGVDARIELHMRIDPPKEERRAHLSVVR